MSSIQRSMLELVKIINKHVLRYKQLEVSKMVAEFVPDFDKPSHVSLIQIHDYETSPKMEPSTKGG